MWAGFKAVICAILSAKLIRAISMFCGPRRPIFLANANLQATASKSRHLEMIATPLYVAKLAFVQRVFSWSSRDVATAAVTSVACELCIRIKYVLYLCGHTIPDSIMPWDHDSLTRPIHSEAFSSAHKSKSTDTSNKRAPGPVAVAGRP